MLTCTIYRTLKIDKYLNVSCRTTKYPEENMAQTQGRKVIVNIDLGVANNVYESKIVFTRF